MVYSRILINNTSFGFNQRLDFQIYAKLPKFITDKPYIGFNQEGKKVKKVALIRLLNFATTVVRHFLNQSNYFVNRFN